MSDNFDMWRKFKSRTKLGAEVKVLTDVKSETVITIKKRTVLWGCIIFTIICLIVNGVVHYFNSDEYYNAILPSNIKHGIEKEKNCELEISSYYYANVEELKIKVQLHKYNKNVMNYLISNCIEITGQVPAEFSVMTIAVVDKSGQELSKVDLKLSDFAEFKKDSGEYQAIATIPLAKSLVAKAYVLQYQYIRMFFAQKEVSYPYP